MEVLHGNRSGSKHSRRRSDKLAQSENRTLDWELLESDIALFPHSPLALADVLSVSGGFLDLIAAEFNGNDAEEKPTPTPHNQKPSISSTASANNAVEIETKHAPHRQKRAPRQRFNLLTRHSTEDLLKQCKKMLVDNALVKNKGERQLYLAAGFITWSDTSNPISRKRAPLLLYPALLVRIPNESGYEIRFTGDSPEFNQALLHHAEQHHDVKIPLFNHNEPLSDFLAQVAQSIRNVDALVLEFDVALGSASLLHNEFAGTTIVELPDVPANFDRGLAMSITGNKSLVQLNAVLQLIPDYSVDTAQNDLTSNSVEPTESVAGLRKYAARLAAEGLDHVEFRQLATLPGMISKWTDAVQTGLKGKTLSHALNLPGLSVRELIRLTGIIELIDKAPATIEQLGHADLCYSSSTLLLRRAQHQARLIEDELAALQEHFVLDKVPAKSQLLSLMAELGGTVEHEVDLVDAEYFNARRQFMEFSIKKPAQLTTEHRRMLSQLAKVLRFRELFVNNTEYRSALGSGYKGLRTDWAVLTQTSEYARELAEVVESETVAAKILGNWREFRSSFSAELEVLQTAGDGCRRLLGIVGTRWQTQSVTALLNHASLTRTRLEEWRNTYGSLEKHADRTAAIVLSSFSGKSREDMVVETHVDETRTRINQQLEAGEISRQQIAETLKWLLAASHTATEHEMDIDAIVEHLQIA